MAEAFYFCCTNTVEHPNRASETKCAALANPLNILYCDEWLPRYQSWIFISNSDIWSIFNLHLCKRYCNLLSQKYISLWNRLSTLRFSFLNRNIFFKWSCSLSVSNITYYYHLNSFWGKAFHFISLGWKKKKAKIYFTFKNLSKDFSGWGHVKEIGE